MYSDPHASIIDQAGLQAHHALIKPLSIYVTNLADLVDQPHMNQSAVECVQSLLDRWAQAGAMLVQPTNFSGIRERARFTIGINVVVLKRRALGGTVDQTTTNWLRALNTDVMLDFGSRRYFDNLAVWSGVDAASYALISGDAKARQYANKVWQLGLSNISKNGSVRSEINRESRSLLYHQYYLSGLLMLRALRASIGEPPSETEDSTLKRLADLVATSLCDPNVMRGLAGGWSQETPPAYQFAVPIAFGDGLLDNRWKQCGPATPQRLDMAVGGDMDLARDAFQRLK